MWTKARLTIYLGSVLAGIGFLLAVLGAGNFDPATGVFALHPFNVYWLAGVVAGPVASTIAAVAVIFGWGPKQ